MKQKILLSLITSLLLVAQAQATVKPRYANWRQDPSRFEAELQAQAEREGTQHARAPRRIGLRSTAPLTSVGSPKVPVILVQFADLRFVAGLHADDSCRTQAQADTVNRYYQLYCNGTGQASAHYTAAGSGGAISEYFRDQSDGQFTPEFVVIGPVQLDSSFAYYGQGRSDTHINEFYAEALAQAQETYGEAWSQFDNDSDGVVDMAFFVYAGPGANALDTDDDPQADDYIWPKETSRGGSINGVQYGCYACCNETYNGRVDGIGVFVHELSHALGLPDFYDTNYTAYGLDYWDVMDSGNYCANGYVPCNYSAYERDFMGWKSLVTLDPAQPQTLTLQPISSNGQGYKMVNPENPNEYYIIENRQNKGWDTYIGRGTSSAKSHGLLVSHIDYLQTRWTANSVNTDPSHQRYTIIPADGTLDSYMYVDNSDDYAAFMLSAQGDLFPGLTARDSLQADAQPVFTTTGATPGLLSQPLFHITEQADLSLTLDYMADSANAIRSPRAGNAPAGGTVYDLSGRPLRGAARKGLYIQNGHKYWVR